MKGSRFTRLAAAVVLTYVMVVPMVPAQIQGGRDAVLDGEQGTFFDSLDVSVVNIETFVTDKAGNRVSGLTRDDFEIFEDRKPVEITNFYAVRGGRPVTASQVTPESPEPPDPRTAAVSPAAIEIPPDQRLHLVIYFDNLFLRPFNRNKLIDHVRRFVFNNVAREDRVMLATFDRSLHVRHPFTTNHTAVMDELDAIETLSAFGVQARSERRDVLKRVETAQTDAQARVHVDFFAKALHNDLQQSIRALEEVVSSLAGLPGRKAILYVSDGIPMNPATDLFFLIDQKYSGGTTSQLAAARYSGRRLFRALTAHANANRVSFYTIEAAGLTSHASLSADYGHTDASLLEADVMMDADREDSLMFMAAKTGGLAITNTNNFDGAFSKIAEDFQSYYSLGYSPAHAVPGRYYRIEVRVKKPGLSVRHREGYRDKTAETRVNEGTMAALIHGAVKNSLGIILDTGPERPAEDGRFLVPVLVHIPLGQITLVPRGDEHRAEVRVSMAVIDDEGRTSPLHHTAVPISVPSSELQMARDRYFVYQVELLMRRGVQNIAVGVRDDFAGGTSFLRQAVRVGA